MNTIEQIVFDIPQPNPYIKRIKMGQVYYLIKTSHYSYDIRKVVVMNFPDSTRPHTYIKLKEICGIEDKTLVLEISMSQVLAKGQRKDIIVLERNTALCENKQALVKFMKQRILNQIGYSRYILEYMFSPIWLRTIKEEYKRAIDKIKSL